MFDYRRLLILTLAFLFLVDVACAQGPGKGIFERRCGRCHGADAGGGESGPNIISQLAARNNQDLEEFIRAGRPASGMPAFDFSLNEMTNLVSYLRVLAPTSRAETLTVLRKRVQTTDGQTIEGQVLNAGLTDLQLRTDDMKVRLLRKAEKDQYRLVTSQQDWPSYDGDPSGNRYSKLTQIDKSNAGRLTTRWIFQVPGVAQVENTPIVVQGIMYISSVNECWAVDPGTGRTIWHYLRPRTKGHFGNASKGIQRGVAWAGDRIFQLTDNAHLIALNRFNGELLWETEMADWRQNYDGTSAPLVVGNLVVSGVGGGDRGVRGFVAAYDQTTGKEVWRFWTVPRPGEPGSETWTGKEVEHRGGATWLTGSYDPQLDTVYWAVGNPGPDFDGSERRGDNLYTDSVVALNAKTGKLKWYYQFTPHDLYDWDAQEPLALVDVNWQGQPRKLLIQANRNGFFYVLDRTDGKLLLAKSFLKNLNWAERIGKDGRPVLKTLPQRPNETYVCPGLQGGTNWFSTSYNPTTGLYYFNALERCNLFSVSSDEWEPGNTYLGGAARSVPGETFQKFLRAVNIQTGEIAWELLQMTGAGPASAGVLSTASGVVFFGENSGAVMAVDASNGKTLWQFPTNYPARASPMTYMFDNKQYVAIAVGQDIIAFSLPD